MHSVVVGLGEVGGALLTLLSFRYECLGIDIKTPREEYPDSCEFLNICIPYSDSFVEQVNEYIELLKPKLVINHSSVPIGTTKKLNGTVVHSPVRGKHPDILSGLKDYVKYVGFNNEEGRSLAEQYLGKAFNISLVQDSNATEFLKLQSLVKYLGYLAIAGEINDMAKAIGVDYELVKDWDITQNNFIDKYYSGMRWPILSPPTGKIGGHCVMPISRMVMSDERLVTPVLAQAYKKYENL